MQQTILQLEKILAEYPQQLALLSGAALTTKPLPHKWSRKEVIGHLVDSAQNNIRRFVVAQYEDVPVITYAQDNWVAAANYQQYNSADLLALWQLLNKHLCQVLKNIPPGLELRQARSSELHSIEWLAADYNKHLLHHLHQVLDLEPIAYP